jgi:hypothetical protein
MEVQQEKLSLLNQVFVIIGEMFIDLRIGKNLLQKIKIRWDGQE